MEQQYHHHRHRRMNAVVMPFTVVFLFMAMIMVTMMDISNAQRIVPRRLQKGIRNNNEASSTSSAHVRRLHYKSGKEKKEKSDKGSPESDLTYYTPVAPPSVYAYNAPPLAPSTLAPTVPGAYSLPNLPYPYEALEPYIDTTTMRFHHDKHHATYVANINKAVAGQPKVPILDLQAKALQAGTAIRNNGGGHYNHAFFWLEMAPPDQAKNTKPSAQLEALINESFGSIEEMRTQFETAAAPGALFGSGWVWLCVSNDGTKLVIVGTPNQDNPLMEGVTDEVMFPILGLDVWEHAYYLKYQNLRVDYISNWWNLVNWDRVSENCAYVVQNHVGVSV